MFEIRNNAYNVDFCIPENPKSLKQSLFTKEKITRMFSENIQPHHITWKNYDLKYEEYMIHKQQV